MLSAEDIHGAPDEKTAQAILVNHQDKWARRSGDYHWVFADSLLGVFDAYLSDPTVIMANDYFPHYSAGKWYEMAAKTSWRPQLVSEFQQLDQGIIPGTVGMQPWLLEFAIESDRTELVRTLLGLGVKVETVHLEVVAGSMIHGVNPPVEILTLLLEKADIEVDALASLTHSAVLPYSLPYLSGFATILAEHCPVYGLRNLKENGFDISDHNNMIRALQDRHLALDEVLYVRDNTDTTPDVLEAARESAWYWFLYASEDERQAVLDRSGSWRPLVELMFRDGPALRDMRCELRRWHEHNAVVFTDLFALPAGIARSILHAYEDGVYPTNPLPWPNNDLRELLERKGEFGEYYPWTQSF